MRGKESKIGRKEGQKETHRRNAEKRREMEKRERKEGENKVSKREPGGWEQRGGNPRLPPPPLRLSAMTLKSTSNERHRVDLTSIK